MIIEEHDMGNDSYGLNTIKKDQDGHIEIIQDIEEPVDKLSHILGSIVDQIPDERQQDDDEQRPWHLAVKAVVVEVQVL